jgi:hypothetical protein
MIYIGYSLLEKLIARIDSCHTLYLTLLDETIPGTNGIDLFRCELMVQVPAGNSPEPHLLYWRMLIGQAVAPGGKPFPDDFEKIKVRGKSALEAIRQYLGAQPQVRQVEEGAVIAMPRNLKLLIGCAGCLVFDPTSGIYRLKDNGRHYEGNGKGLLKETEVEP